MNTGKPIILFDGVCNLCNRTVQFIIRKDKKKQFLFGSLQGKTGQEMLQRFRIPKNEFNSFILVEGERYYSRSTAALRMLRRLGAGWNFLYGLILLPSFLRDAVYNWVARNRYKWFGKKEECMVPDPGVKDRFLD